jgi:hypothetical protein
VQDYLHHGLYLRGGPGVWECPVPLPGSEITAMEASFTDCNTYRALKLDPHTLLSSGWRDIRSMVPANYSTFLCINGKGENSTWHGND